MPGQPDQLLKEVSQSVSTQGQIVHGAVKRDSLQTQAAALIHIISLMESRVKGSLIKRS